MMKKQSIFRGMVGVLAAITVPTVFSAVNHTSLPANAALTCIPLRVVGSRTETVARKRVELRLGPGNANTDFSVPTGRRFSSYIVTLTPENAATYKVAVNLKFNDNTSRNVLSDKTVELERNTPYQLQVLTPAGLTRQPYQVNLFVTGTNGNAYRARVSACQ